MITKAPGYALASFASSLRSLRIEPLFTISPRVSSTENVCLLSPRSRPMVACAFRSPRMVYSYLISPFLLTHTTLRPIGGKNMANLTDEIRINDATSDASVAGVDIKLEVVVIPVSDVDRAKEFYESLGWRLDADFAHGEDWRCIQFTPPGSGCSIIFGKNVTAAAPGSAQGLYLIVSDIEAVRQELLRRGVEISEVFHEAGGVYAGPDEPYLFGRLRVSGPDPEHRSYRSFASFSDPDGNGWLFQEVTRGWPDASTRPRRPSRQPTIWRVRFGARPARTGSTRSGRDKPTRTGPTGTPRTWWRSRLAGSCHNEPLRRNRYRPAPDDYRGRWPNGPRSSLNEVSRVATI
jgi:catechol 2,3-dioxygenase-like lactoylglutathione lyase family enzyme